MRLYILIVFRLYRLKKISSCFHYQIVLVDYELSIFNRNKDLYKTSYVFKTVRTLSDNMYLLETWKKSEIPNKIIGGDKVVILVYSICLILHTKCHSMFSNLFHYKYRLYL